MKPAMGAVLRDAFIPSMPRGGITSDLTFLIIAIVGTTVAPWQLFFQQSCIADKKLRFSDVRWARLDTFVRACVTVTVAGRMMLAGNASHLHGFNCTDPAQMASDIGTLAGPAMRTLILMMMINAAFLGTTAISRSSAWAYGEVRG